jgi:protein-S-isoprenylcysteine O-methyltransferase Ste14
MSDTRPLVFVAPFAFAFWGVMAWAYFIEWRQMQRKRAVSGSHGGADRYSGLVISIGSSVIQVGAFVLAFQPQWRFPGHVLMPSYWAGLAVIVLGMLLRMHCWRVLGEFFTHTVTIVKDHQLVDNGAYRWVRHPSYLGAVLTLLGMGLALGSQASMVLIVLGTAAIYVYRIEAEEAALEAALGEPYTQFKKTRKRLIPFVY